MIINFVDLEETRTPNFKGGDGELISRAKSDGMNKIMQLTLEPGSSIGFHKHETNSEMFYIVSGKADVIYDDKTEVAVAGTCHYCPKGHSHSVKNNGDENLVFFAIVTEQ